MTANRWSRTWTALALVAASALGRPAPALAQSGSDEPGGYLRYLTLSYPRIIRETRASAELHLYGDPSRAEFVDVAPRDGIDDRRAARLHALAMRFAPLMVRNTAQVPVDVRGFFESSPLIVDEWDIRPATPVRRHQQRLNLNQAGNAECQGDNDQSDDCRLIALLQRFGPDRQPVEPEARAAAEAEMFSVLYLDLPGDDEASWKRSSLGPAAVRTEPRVFVHPFIADAPSGRQQYEFVLQYWFFYPYNDGPNNHEGDWEHINVIISPRSQVTTPLDAAAIGDLLSDDGRLDGPDPIVLKRVEYYLHHFVAPVDFSSPNAYAPRATWEAEAKALAKQERGNTKAWSRVRARAWQDKEESRINTRPIVWIGGDSVGVYNLLQMPGLKDRDGHASYPFRGYYTRIGTGGVGERVVADFDHVEYFANPDGPWPLVEDYAAAGRITLTPDWERVLDLTVSDARSRRDWAWLVLPLRFGQPATPSPGAGVIAHADTGNLAPVGPAFNDGWNRVGDSAGYALYELVETSWTTPLGPADSFVPRMGFLNAPILYVLLRPPFDLVWRTAALPLRAALGTRQPTFQPASAPAARNVSIEAGTVTSNISNDFSSLFFNRDQLVNILVYTVLFLPDGVTDLGTQARFGWTTSPTYALTFHLSPRLSVESSLVRTNANVGFDFTSARLSQPIRVRGDFRQTEFHGTLRVNLTRGPLQPYVKFGSGFTAYRLRNVAVNEIPLVNPTSPQFQPKGRWWNLGFNETILGAGLDWSQLRLGPAWLGGRLDWSAIHHGLGFEQTADVEDFPLLAKELAGARFSVWRHQFRALVTIGF